MHEGTPFSYELDFSTGLPTGAVVYSLLGNNGTPVLGYDAVSFPVAADALSVVILIPGTANTCAAPLFETRTLTWSYPTANGVVNGRTRYRIEKDIPFQVSAEGVRSKLGVEDHEVEDKDIDLLLAYASLADQYDLSQYEHTGTYKTLLIINAIEAQAALQVLPSLQLAVAQAEDSGTNKYQRFKGVDWAGMAEALTQELYRVDAMYGTNTDSLIGTIFVVAGPTTDRVTNSQYV